MWLMLLQMLGKGQPTGGFDSFTALSANALPGKPRRFGTKSTAGLVNASNYYLAFVAQFDGDPV